MIALARRSDDIGMRLDHIVGAAFAVLLAGGCAAGDAMHMALHPSDPVAPSVGAEAATAQHEAEALYQVDVDPSSEPVVGNSKHAGPPKVTSKVGTGANAGIVGKWSGKIDMPKSGKDDPMGKMAESMAQLFLGGLSLELRSNNTFVLNVMVPIEGTYARSGRNLTLTPTMVAGMTQDEARKMRQADGKATPEMKPMRGSIAADGSNIVLQTDNKKEGELVFRRAAPEKPVVATVTSSEKALVGAWKGSVSMAVPPNASAAEREKAEMGMRVLNGTLELELRANNTFKMRMMMELEGKWSVKSGKVRLDVTGLAGMGPSTSSKGDPLELTVADSGRSLEVHKKGPGGTESMTFKRK